MRAEQNSNTIDWSNPNNPQTKKALQDLMNVIAQSVHQDIALYKNLQILDQLELENDKNQALKMQSEADITMREFWQKMQQMQESQLTKPIPQNEYEQELSGLKNLIDTLLLKLTRENQQLKADLVSHTQVYQTLSQKIKADKTARESAKMEKITQTLSDKIIEVKNLEDQLIPANTLLEKIKLAQPKDAHVLLEQADTKKVITNLVAAADEKDKAGVFTQMVYKNNTLSNINLARELLGADYDGSNVQLFQMVKKLDKLTSLMKDLNENDISKDSAEMKDLFNSLNTLDKYHTKIEKNESDIKLAKNLLDDVSNKLSQIERKQENSSSLKPK